MSSPGLPTEVRHLPLTGRGGLLSALALLLLGFGIFRIELAALIWGSAFLLLVLYSLVGSHLYRLLVRRYLAKELQAVDITLPVQANPGDRASAEIKVALPRIPVPGIQVRLVYRLYFRSRPPVLLHTLLSPGINKMVIEFIPRRRGQYRGRGCVLEFRDLLGFVRLPFPVSLEEQLKVFPVVHSLGAAPPRMDEGGEKAELRESKRRSEELLEVRKYFAGDDQRKINWKIFAHLGELFIRIGEETPPPESRYLIVLDSSPSAWVPMELEGDYLDRMVESCASLMNHLLQRGFQIMFSNRGGDGAKHFTLEGRRELLSLLAGIWWTDRKDLELPARKGLKAILFSSPGSRGLQEIITRLTSRGWEVSLYLQGLRFQPPPRPALNLKSLLFLPHQQSSPFPSYRKPPHGQQIANKARDFADALSQELSKYRGPPWRLKHVEEI